MYLLESLIDWSRAQFALTACYHWLFVPLTLGLALVMGIMETLYVVKKDEFWKATAKFWQKLFGLGTLEVKSSDKTCPSLPLINIKKSNAVKELISKLVEDERDRKRVTGREIINNHDHDCDGMDDYDNDTDIDNSGEIF